MRISILRVKGTSFVRTTHFLTRRVVMKARKIQMMSLKMNIMLSSVFD